MLAQDIVCWIKVFFVGSRYCVLNQGILCRIKVFALDQGIFGG